MTKTKIKSKKDFLKAAKEKGLKVSEWAKSMMDSMTFEDSEVEYVAKTVRELGLYRSPTFREFLKELPRKGYGMLSPSQALMAALEHELNKDEWIRIAMETIPSSDGYPSVFRVVHDDGGQWLDGYYYNADNELDLGGLWLVSVRKDSLSPDPSPSTLSSLNSAEKNAIDLLKSQGYKVIKEM